MRTVTVTASRTYEVLIGRKLLHDAGERLRSLWPPRRVCVVADNTVFDLYGETVCAALTRAGFDLRTFVFPAGEVSKNMHVLQNLLEYMAGQELTRQDAILALGGGVPGDLAGFAASCYLRGIPFVQVPTTLLAAVDSSVGGKTGVNLTHGKNLAGTFWQPSLVLCDCDTFASLPQAALLDGAAETIKYGVILDRELFDFLAARSLDFFTQPADSPDVETVVERCVSLKRDVVMADERDTGKRQLLNFGHTIGHAIEKCSDFQISHGHAVAIGMLLEARAALAANPALEDCATPIENILTRFGFDLICPWSAQQLAKAALADKKRAGSAITLIVPYALGDCRLHTIDTATLEAYIGGGLAG